MSKVRARLILQQPSIPRRGAQVLKIVSSVSLKRSTAMCCTHSFGLCMLVLVITDYQVWAGPATDSG